ncbi:hypothetical protein [Allobranchiibius sp. GilTou38]|uniref:NUDIX hydrolase n=1 Tax=Allobranchiibius sp. GilTou38 TaxID=2815210 RepID=UPI003260DEC9
MSSSGRPAVGFRAELVAVVASVGEDGPAVLASGDPLQLPAGELRADHDSLQEGVRVFAAEQTGHTLGYVEQLYTFADLGRGDGTGRVISISYLGLTRADTTAAEWAGAYTLLPWEDRRSVGTDQELVDDLARWVRGVRGAAREAREERREHLFGTGSMPWRPELALQRYELLWEAGIVAESPRAKQVRAQSGVAMLHDHRRIVATGLSRLRSALQYRPVVFELMPPTFTLGQLQDVVEAIAGQDVHKQNFRRLVEQQHQLVEPTGDLSHGTGGRPARRYRFRREVFAERAQVGTKLPIPRGR